MPEDLFQMLSEPAALDTAWDRVRTNAGCAGGDGETIAGFAKRALVFILHRLVWHSNPLWRPDLRARSWRAACTISEHSFIG